jgi:glycosyltransferase involved in cell wall biosynthesis
MVYGVRQNRDDESRIKRQLANLFYKLLGKLTKIKIPAHAGDFRLLDRRVVDVLNTMPEFNRFMKGLYAWVGFKTIGIPFKVNKRQKGKSSWRLGSLTELAITGITSFSDIPLRIWGVIGFMISVLAFAYGLYIVGDTLLFGADVPGYATIIVAIMFFGGIQLLSIGILGEYIARIFNEVKQRPPYLIAQKYGFDDE